MESTDNITRRRRISNSSDHNTSDILSQTLDDTYNSLPDFSDPNIEHVLKLKERIELLEMELQIANKEIDTLSLENRELKRHNEDLLKKNDLLKRIAHSPAKSRQSPKKTITGNMHTQTDITKNRRIDSNTMTKVNRQTTVTQTTLPEKILRQKPPIKMCIISANKQNNMLALAENTLEHYTNLCHYLKPNSTIVELLKDLDKKLWEYTLDDYCIIFIGEEDLKKTNDYVELIIHIRQIISKVQNTNIVLIAPTYKCGKYTNMFNWRVEHFNNLLYLDILTHEHAYIIDSNQNLNYDHTMFCRKFGHVNNFGIRIIFKDINKCINDIIISNNKVSTNDNNKVNYDNTLENQSNLFRD
ncbi:hypothetical protein K1T71_004458 [Dendrolimus kikuchii]|uniref:Uncharacterized protein n=1 Tax=Dendrolimus kikuchii TaxID=765133 RepID=A0ACC1D7N4_9NEOP|nr:hypothetical protein K1T71_004458 [Dendrolimus kikuchii]